jgi:hypothetical protein
MNVFHRNANIKPAVSATDGPDGVAT